MIVDLSLGQWLTSAFGVMLVGAVGYVLRFLTERSHAKEMEALKADYSRELEHLRSELGQRSVQFSKLHQDRVHEITTIYDSLLGLQSELHTYLLIVQHGTAANKQQARSDAYDNVYKELHMAWVAYRRRRFYFDKPMSDIIEAVFKPMYDIEQVVYGWQNTNVTLSDPGYDKVLRDKFKADLDEARSIMRGALQQALAAMEESMRMMLGVRVPEATARGKRE